MAVDEVEDYVGHRLSLVGWQRRPAFAADAWPAIHRETDGIPRRINQLANRLLLFAAVEGTVTIDADAVATVVADLDAERPYVPAQRAERVLPLRSVPRPAETPRTVEAPRPAAEQAPAPVADFAHERRVAALEARIEEQDAALRRVLTMLIDWVENGAGEPSYRTNAA
jgi:hypothetical protein